MPNEVGGLWQEPSSWLASSGSCT